MVEIRPVTSRRELHKFIQFPNRLFKNVPTYIPPLVSDEVKLLTEIRDALKEKK